MKLDQVIEEIQDWLVPQLLPLIIEKRILLIGISGKKRKNYLYKALEDIPSIIDERLKKMQGKGAIPVELNLTELQKKIYQVVKKFSLNFKENDMLTLIADFKRRQQEKRKMRAAIFLFEDWQEKAQALIQGDVLSSFKSEQTWKAIIIQASSEISYLEQLKLKVHKQLGVIVVLVCLGLLIYNSPAFHNYKNPIALLQAAHVDAMIGTVGLLLMGLIIFYSRAILPSFTPNLKETEERMKAEMVALINATYKRESFHPKYEFVANTTPQVVSRQETEVEPVVYKKEKKKTRGVAKPKNEAEVVQNSTELNSELMLVNSTTNLYLHFSRQAVERLLPDVNNQKKLVNKFENAVFSGYLKSCFYFFKSEDGYTLCKRKAKIKGDARLYFTETLANDGKHVLEPAGVIIHPHQRRCAN